MLGCEAADLNARNAGEIDVRFGELLAEAGSGVLGHQVWLRLEMRQIINRKRAQSLAQ
jgi:hypothetical protein